MFLTRTRASTGTGWIASAIFSLIWLLLVEKEKTVVLQRGFVGGCRVVLRDAEWYFVVLGEWVGVGCGLVVDVWAGKDGEEGRRKTGAECCWLGGVGRVFVVWVVLRPSASVGSAAHFAFARVLSTVFLDFSFSFFLSLSFSFFFSLSISLQLSLSSLSPTSLSHSLSVSLILSHSLLLLNLHPHSHNCR